MYWVGGAYLGVGAGAHSYLPAPELSSALRRENVRRPEDYLSSALSGRTGDEFEEHLSRAEVLGDRLMIALRPRWGIDLAELAQEAALPREALAPIDAALDRLAGPIAGGADRSAHRTHLARIPHERRNRARAAHRQPRA